MENLISMTDFVLEQHEQCISSTNATYKYANFLKRALELWMFVPCDENGYILNEPISLGMFESENPYFEIYLKSKKEYYKAKERCLFEGFECQKQGGEYLVKFGNEPVWVNWNNSKTIENLARLKPQLTQTAIKQLGL